MPFLSYFWFKKWVLHIISAVACYSLLNFSSFIMELKFFLNMPKNVVWWPVLLTTESVNKKEKFIIVTSIANASKYILFCRLINVPQAELFCWFGRFPASSIDSILTFYCCWIANILLNFMQSLHKEFGWIAIKPAQLCLTVFWEFSVTLY